MKNLVLTLCLYLVYTQSNCQIITNGLVGYYPFNGNVLDYSGNDYHGTETNLTYSNDPFNNILGASSFNGADAYINVGDIDDYENTDSLSVCFWMKSDSVGFGGGANAIPLMTDWWTSTLPDSCSWGIFLIDDSIWFNVSDGIGFDPAKFSMEFVSNDWKFISFTFNNGLIKYYLNGILQGTKTMSVSSIHNSNTTFKIGDWRSQSLPTYKTYYGDLDELMIYRRELSEGEIQIIYNNYYASLDGIAQLGVKIYPNPSESHFLIECEKQIKSIEVYSLDGRLVSLIDNIGEKKYLWEPIELQRGAYQIKVKSIDNDINSFRVILN